MRTSLVEKPFFQVLHLAAWMAVSLLAPAGAAERVRVISTPGGGAVPDAEVGRDGAIHVAYVTGEDAFYVKSLDQGKTFTAPLRINSEPERVHPANLFRGPDLALGKDDMVHVVWYGNGYQRKLPADQRGAFYSHLNAARTAFVPTRNLNRLPSDNYSLAANERGDVAVIWMAAGLFVTSSTDGGNTFAEAEPVRVADTCQCCASRAYYRPDGTLFIDYREKANNLRDMHLLARARGEREFKKQKISQTPWQINACPMAGTFLTGAGKGLAMAWETKGEVYYTRIDLGAGVTPRAEIKAAERGKWPVVLAAPDGSVLVSWKELSNLRWQLFDRADKPVGPAGSKAAGNTTRHAGVVTADGNFLLID